MSSEAALREDADLQSVPFQYVPPDSGEMTSGDGDSAWNNMTTKAQMERQLREAFERGLVEGEKRAKTSYTEQLKAQQDGIRSAVQAFQSAREEYFNRIEPEVVQLALAIARKILHRESQIDPLLLTGLVHVALDKLDAGTRVRLKVHPADAHFWNEFFAHGDSGQVPDLSGDPTLGRGECLLETEVGSTQISLETQLKEIEQGFFDLLNQRPRVS
jgi:flagellar assembly protein FliH